MCPKGADGMANSEDSGQTAPVVWVFTFCPDLSVQNLRIIMVSFDAFLSKIQVVHLDSIISDPSGEHPLR